MSQALQDTSILTLLPLLVVSPLFILKVIIGIIFLIVYRGDNRLLAVLGKIYFSLFICIYLVALYLYLK